MGKRERDERRIQFRNLQPPTPPQLNFGEKNRMVDENPEPKSVSFLDDVTAKILFLAI